VSLIAAGVAYYHQLVFCSVEIQKRKVTAGKPDESEVKYDILSTTPNSVIMEIDTIGNITFINKFGA